MGIFSGMEKFGLGKFKDTSVIEEKKKAAISDLDKDKDGAPAFSEKDVLFDKNYKCPICDMNFRVKAVRTGKVKIASKDTDLRPVYEGMDPLKYDVVTCDKCGYSSLVRYYGKLTTKQMRAIREEVGSSFSGIDSYVETYSYDDAILRYKLALICAVVKNSKNSEKSYLCLKLAWILRGKRLTLDPKNPSVKELYLEELECLKNAYEGFNIALSSEPLPIAGMDENTVMYIMADIARKLKKYDESARLIGSIITAKNVSPRLKEEALNLKELVKEEMKQIEG